MLPRVTWCSLAVSLCVWSSTTFLFAQDQSVPKVPAADSADSPAAKAATDNSPAVDKPPELFNQPTANEGQSPTNAAPNRATPAANPPANPKPAAPAKKPAPILPWKGVYFDNDFSYKGKPDAPYFPGEELKNIPLFYDGETPWLTFSAGGEVRHRYMDERNRLRGTGAPPASQGQSSYNLWRWRQYFDLKASDMFRVYFEGIDASIFDRELPVTGIDKNRWDIQNAFFDVKFLERDDKPVYLRVGRQELLYGAPSAASPGQQLISPLDWANTRRNFEGFRILSKGSDFDIDLFAVRPVNTATNHLGAAGVAFFDNRRDSADDSRWLCGIYTAYRGFEGHVLEPYYIVLDTDHAKDAAALADGDRHTLGLRWTMSKPFGEGLTLHSDIEGAYQFGQDGGDRVQAGFFTSKQAVAFTDMPWNPTIGYVYFFGSGDTNPTDGRNSTFSQLFPLGHAYWGIIDNLSGQNLNQIGIQGTVKPLDKLTFVSAMHWFNVANNSDALYTITGANAGARNLGKEIGEELDLIATYAFAPNFDVQAGYSWFWYGTRVTNSPVLNRGDASQFYIQTSIRY